jgi:hypothetical protein
MGYRLMDYFEKAKAANVVLPYSRMSLRLGISRKRAEKIEDTPELLSKARSALHELIKMNGAARRVA